MCHAVRQSRIYKAAPIVRVNIAHHHRTAAVNRRFKHNLPARCSCRKSCHCFSFARHCTIVGDCTGLLVHAATPPPINDPVEGQQLAHELRNVTPSENSSFKATLRLTAPGQPAREVPLLSSIRVNGSNWISNYEARPTNGAVETLVIRRTPGQPNEYEWRRGTETMLTLGTATNSLAGSDFALLDLGLDFFQWPGQSLVFRQMRKGRGCDVLESRPAVTNFYSRVLSWIDQESRAEGQPGLLLAEAYDAQGNLLKEFEIKDFERVNGRWEVRELEIRNVRAKTSTRLRFHFEER